MQIWELLLKYARWGYPLVTKGNVPENKRRKTDSKKLKRKGSTRLHIGNMNLNQTGAKMTCNMRKVYRNENVGQFILGSRTFRKEFLKSHEKS